MAIIIKRYYNCYDQNKQFLGCSFCKATEIRNEFPNAKYIKNLKKPWNTHYFKDIDDEIRDTQNMAQ